MNKNTLIEILNSNQELLQDLAQSEFLQNNFVGMLRNLESIIPEDSRENFYTNLKSLRLNFNDETMIEKQHGGAYSRKNNEISMDKSILNIAGRKISDGEINFDEEMLMAMYHELLHMASTTRDDYGGVGGFQNIEKTEEGEFLYADILEGMTEGFTEYLTLLSFGKENFETSSTYGRQINSMNHLSMIVGLETMKKAYFNNRNGIQHIEKALQEIDGKQSHIDLYMDIESDYKFGQGEELFEPTTLANIDKRLLELSKGKIEIMRKKNPNLSEEYVMDFWTKVSKVINSKENLKSMGEDASLYRGIDELENIFKDFLSDVDSKGKSRAISIEQVEEVIQNVKISDIDIEYDITQSETQELKNDDLNKGGL